MGRATSVCAPSNGANAQLGMERLLSYFAVVPATERSAAHRSTHPRDGGNRYRDRRHVELFSVVLLPRCLRQLLLNDA